MKAVSEFVPTVALAKQQNTNVFQRSSLESQKHRGAQGVSYKYNFYTMPVAVQCSLQSPIMPAPSGVTQKAEFCRNWIESAKCRFEDKCRFAHAQEELTPMAVLMYDDKFKANNCRTFYKTSMCNFGEKCMFRHEHRYMVQLHRHYYTPHLYVYESLYASSMDKTRFISGYETRIAKLPVF